MNSTTPRTASAPESAAHPAEGLGTLLVAVLFLLALLALALRASHGL